MDARYFVAFFTFLLLLQARTVGRQYLARFYSSIVSRLTLLRNLMATRQQDSQQTLNMVITLLHLTGKRQSAKFLRHSTLQDYRYSPRFACGGRPHRRLFLANSNIYTKNPSKTLFFTVFLQCFPSKNLHVFRHKVGPKHWFLQCFQGSGIKKTFTSLISSNP